MIASEGHSYFFNPSAGIYNQPFLEGVYKPFGFSYDGRYFLYLKSNGRMPTLALYAYDLSNASEKQLTTDRVYNAVWSPDSHDVAFIAIESADRFHVSVYDSSSATVSEIFSGMLDPDYLEWSSGACRYRKLIPQGTDYFHNGRFDAEAHRYDLKTKKDSVVTDDVLPGSAGRGQSQLMAASGAPRLATARGGIAYMNDMENGSPVVKRVDSSGQSEVVAKGHIYATTDDGIVVREFDRTGTNYRYIDAANTSSPQNFTFTGSWKMPFGGSAYLVQGGGLFTSGACDGRACLVVGHNGALGYALDWQQTPEDGQGNTHVLAVEDGTVVALGDGVTCNTGTPGCPDYQTPCNDNGGAGNYVAIAHPDGSFSFYGHMKPGLKVALNQTVTQGTYLGDQWHSGVANSYNTYHGCSDHLHFQRQGSPAIWAQSIPTDFTELPCTLSCTSAYVSQNVETSQDPVSALTLLLNPSALVGGPATSANKVVLKSPAPAGGAAVTLSSSNSGVASVPATVSVPAGAVASSFPITTNGVSATSPVTISGSYGNENASALLTVNPVSLTWLSLGGTAVAGGTPLAGNEVDLSGAAPTGGVTVALTSSDPNLATVPSTVLVPAGSTFANFTINTATVAAPSQVTISASFGGVTMSAVVTINSTFLSSLTISPSVVGGGGTTGGNRVVLNGWAPAGNAAVSVTSSDPNVAQVPPIVTVPAGSNISPNFDIVTTPVSATTVVTITASYGGVVRTGTLTVNPIILTKLNMYPTQLIAGKGSSTNSVVLNGPAPPGDAQVVLTSSDPNAVVIPSTVAIPAGSNAASFTITGGYVGTTTQVTITAAYGGNTDSGILTISPTAVNSMSVYPSQVIAGKVTTSNMVTLNGPAPSGDAQVTLTSSDPNSASVPVTLTIPAGSYSASFPITGGYVSSPTQVTISATYGGNTVNAVVTALPIAPASMGLYPTQLVGGKTTNVTLILNGPAPPSGVAVAITASDGNATVPATVSVPGGSTSTVFTATAGYVSTTDQVTITATYGGNSATVILTVNPTTINTLSVYPPQVIAGKTSSTNTVMLTGPAPPGGAVVTLSSSDPNSASVPATATVPAGSMSASYQITGGYVSAATQVTITGAYGGATASSVVTVNPLAPASLSVYPTQVVSGKTSNATLVLNGPAPPNGAIVAMSASDPNGATVPSTVMVPGGASSTTFQITGGYVSGSEQVTITATYAGNTATVILTVNGTQVNSLTVYPNSTVGGKSSSTNKVILSGPAPAGDAVVALTSSDPNSATVPATVTVPAGSTFAYYTVTGGYVSSTTQVTITATYGGGSANTVITVYPTVITALGLYPTTVVAGKPVVANTVTLNGPAPPGGAVVTLTTSDPSSTAPPATITVPGGSTVSPRFTINTIPVTATAQVTITASYAGSSASNSLTVVPATLSSISVYPSTVVSGRLTTTNRVYLTGPAPAGGAVVTLTSSDPNTATPVATVTVPDGATYTSFNIAAGWVGSTTTATITASYGGTSGSADLTVIPIQLNSLSVYPSSVLGGRASTTNTVTLTGPAPPGDAQVMLTSSDPTVAQVPAFATVPAGSQNSLRFTITTNVVSAPTAVTITATYGGVTRTAVLTVN